MDYLAIGNGNSSKKIVFIGYGPIDIEKIHRGY
jgi:hypothetical protein